MIDTNNLVQRAFTGLILAMVIFYAIIYGPYSFILLILVLNILGLTEFYRLFKEYTPLPRNIAGVILSVCLLITYMLAIPGTVSWRILLINIPLTFGIFVIELYLKSKNPFQHLGFIFLGIICITIPLCFFSALAISPAGKGYFPYLVLGYFFILWANDCGAYFTGKFLGKRPLFLRLSPNKTWEGSLGGALCALVIAFFLPDFFSTYSRTDWLCIALITVVTGTFGDLIKSMMKRSLNVKDSGIILPGHGGILDRFDTLLGSAPFVFFYLAFTGHV
jgi:phosphatidate cytidylyltransferase